MLGRQTIASINLDALKHNYTYFDDLASASRTMPIIKADAYGHGAVDVARALQASAPAFAVAFFDEAECLRDSGISVPILLLEGPTCADELAVCARYNFWAVLHRAEQFDWLRALPAKIRPPIWLKIDTGMHRLGILADEAPKLLNQNRDLFREDTVLCSHFASADELSNPMTSAQLSAMLTLSQQFNLPLSLSNSPAIQGWQQSHQAWNRLGIGLYGGAPIVDSPDSNLKPVMSLDAKIIGLRTIAAGETVGYGQIWTAQRESRIATVAVGYADGYPRHAKVGTPAYINGHRVELVGRVSMDMITFDVTDVDKIDYLDNVELWGDNISVDEVAKFAGTISYDLLAGISPRVKRRYF